MPTSLSQEVKLSTLAYVIVYVKDVTKSLTFYRDTLGFKVKTESPSWIEFETGSTILALHGIDESKEAVPAGSSSINSKDNHRPYLVFPVDDVYFAYENLQKAGIKFSQAPIKVCEEGDKVGVAADFEDLDGNKLSIYSLVSPDKLR